MVLKNKNIFHCHKGAPNLTEIKHKMKISIKISPSLHQKALPETHLKL